MLGAMVNSFPAFRRYFQRKAQRIGKEKLAWWDLFAPTGSSEKQFSWDEAREFILEHFTGFSPLLADFARQAFDRSWIDAEPRPGKTGGAFCMDLPAVMESRILVNFDGSLDQVSTLAHELGHAFHNVCIYAAGKTALQSDTPMTLAETASIMNETIIQQAALARAATPQEELFILETSLIGDAQVIVDITSRFLFEREVFIRREKAELSADELDEIMVWSQKETYGDGLDERYLQPTMWTWKDALLRSRVVLLQFPLRVWTALRHGVVCDLPAARRVFHPQLPGAARLHRRRYRRGPRSRFGIDIRQKDFWTASLKVIEDKIERYIALP